MVSRNDTASGVSDTLAEESDLARADRAFDRGDFFGVGRLPLRVLADDGIPPADSRAIRHRGRDGLLAGAGGGSARGVRHHAASRGNRCIYHYVAGRCRHAVLAYPRSLHADGETREQGAGYQLQGAPRRREVCNQCPRSIRHQAASRGNARAPEAERREDPEGSRGTAEVRRRTVCAGGN